MEKVKFLFLLSVMMFLVSACSQTEYLITGNVEDNIGTGQTGNLASILSDKGISAEYVLLIASDGTAVFITERSFPHITINKHGGKYNTGSDILPPVSGLYDLTEISVYVSGFSSQDHLTPFSQRINDFEFIGESSRDGFIVRIYTLK